MLFAETELNNVENPFLSCLSCGLYKGTNHGKQSPQGQGWRKIMIVGNYPREHEDKTGRLWNDMVGQLLKNKLNEIGINLRKDCVSINALNCYPKNKKVNKDKYDCCYEVKLLPAIKTYKPNVIIALGMEAVISLIGNRWKKDYGSINKWRGWMIPYYDYNCWICPVFHPTQIFNYDQREYYTIWKQDLMNAVSLCDVKLPRKIKPDIIFLKATELKALNEIKEGIVAVDFETTGLKPYREGHEVVACSIAVSKYKAYSFLIPENIDQLMPLIRLLKNRKVKKIAANLKFEENWTPQIWDQLKGIKGWYKDTMIMAHVLDNRAGISGLKFQAFVNFGVVGYGDDIKKYLQSTDGNANSFNTVKTLTKYNEGIRRLLMYVAWDTLLEYRLAMLQMKQLNEMV